MRKVRAGEPISAAEWNRMATAVDRLYRTLEIGGSGHGPARGGGDSNFVKITNDTGGALRRGEIVELQSYDLETAYIDQGLPWFSADTPDETKPFAICLEPIPDGKIGLAQISGRCPALVNVQATTDLWAFVESGQDVLKGDRFWGDVRILHAPSGTGEELVWVSIEKSPQVWKGTADAAIASGATGTVSVFTGTPPGSDSTFNITGCYNDTDGNIPSAGKCSVIRISRQKYVVPWECEA